MNLRRLSIVVLIFAGTMLAFLYYVNYQARTRQLEQQSAAQTTPDEAAQSKVPEAAKPAEETQPATAKPETPAAPEIPDEPAKPAVPAGPRVYTDGVASEQMVKIGSLRSKDEFLLALEVSNRASGVYTAKLTEHFATVADKKRHEEDADTYLQARLDDPEKYKGNYSVLNPVGLEGKTKHLPFETESVTIRIEGEIDPIKASIRNLYWRRHESPVDATGKSQSASFALTILRGMDIADAEKNPLIRLIKTYTVSKQDYSIVMSLKVENLTGKPISVSFDQAGPTGLPKEDIRQDMRMGAYASLHENGTIKNRHKPASNVDELVLDSRREHKIGSSDGLGPVLWVGHSNKFFGSMMYLRPADDGRLEAPLWKAEFYLSRASESATSRTYLTGVRPQLKLTAGQDKTISFDIFVGPKKRSLFSNEDAEYFKPLYDKLSYIGTIDFSSCTFDWLTLMMMGLLDIFSKVALGNYGVAIIMLVLLVRLLLHPLTKKSQVSMMSMQKLGPQMQKLKEKYADDKAALNKEMMSLYKTAGASPLLGCLPMLLQMPIWIALFTGLRATVELRHAAFLPVWITDLAAPDKLITWTTPLPVIGEYIGNSFNLLPILLTIAMFLQMKFGPQAQQMAATANDQAAQQQKMMKYMMPGMMLVFFYKAPSGLTLYIMASTFAGLLDQYFVRKHIREKEAAASAEQATIVVPGKAGRSNRPKKPKGPFYTKGG